MNYGAKTSTNQAGIGDGDAYKVSAQQTNLSSFKLVIGARQLANTTCGTGSVACDKLSAYTFQVAESVVKIPVVDGYKSVKLTTDANNDGLVTAGDTLTYTVTYVNTGNAAVSNFQITDVLPADLTAVAGAQTVTGATKNATYTGTGANTGLLAANQPLAVNSTITVSLPVTVGNVPADNTVLGNQTMTSGTYGSSVTLPSVSSDNVDSTTTFAPSVLAASGFTVVPSGSIAQTQVASVDPTAVNVRLLADLAITKTDGVSSVTSGTSTTYTVRVTNNGPSSVTGATLKDPAALGLTQTAAACTAASGNTCTAATAPTPAVLQGAGVTLPALASGAFYELTVTATVTAASGNVTNTATIAVPSGVTDSVTTNNTASDTDVVSPVFTISGQVYVDTNYGGGAGRAYAAALGMSLRPNVRVELYSSVGGNVLATAFTDSAGAYTFPGQVAGTYKVRVVNSFVTSRRTGGCAVAANVATPPASCAQLPVQTYSYGASQVGGAVPAGTDPPLSTTTLPAGAESVASVTLSSSNVTDVDFGFNFDTIVNTNDSGQGSLRQFVINSNALGNTGLAQVGQSAGKEVSIFMIPSAALSSGVAIINLASGLNVTDSDTSIDAATQTSNVGDTNLGVLGTGGTVGVDNVALGQVSKPEVEITLSGSNTLLASAANFTLRGASLHGGNQLTLGTATNAAENALIEKNVFGTTAAAFALPASSPSAQDGIYLVNASGTVQNNLIGYSGISGINYLGGGAGLTIQNNEFQQSGYVVAGGDAITLTGSSSAKPVTITGNLIANSNSSGIQFEIGSVASNTVTNNTVTGNGLGGAASRLEGSGIHYLARNSTVNSTNSDTISKNVIFNNQKSGLVINFGQKNVIVSQNLFYSNGLTFD